MPEYLESAPKSWKCRLVLAAVPRDGAPYEDESTLPFDRAVSYWDQIYQPLSDLNVRVTAFRSEGRVVAEVSVETEVEAPCARCRCGRIPWDSVRNVCELHSSFEKMRSRKETLFERSLQLRNAGTRRSRAPAGTAHFEPSGHGQGLPVARTTGRVASFFFRNFVSVRASFLASPGSFSDKSRVSPMSSLRSKSIVLPSS